MCSDLHIVCVQPAGTGGQMAIVFSIIGCITGCLGCCTCCMNSGFFSEDPAQVNVTVAAVAAPQVTTEVVTGVAADDTAKPPEPAPAPAPQQQALPPQQPDGAPPPPVAQRNCC